jgi:hypothetical protein
MAHEGVAIMPSRVIRAGVTLSVLAVAAWSFAAGAAWLDDASHAHALARLQSKAQVVQLERVVVSGHCAFGPAPVARNEISQPEAHTVR